MLWRARFGIDDGYVLLAVLFFIIDIVLIVLYLLLGYRRYDTLVNPISFFSVLWMVVAAGANLCLFGYFEPSAEVNFILIIGSMVYALVCLAGKGSKHAFSLDSDSLKGCETLRVKVIVAVNLISFAIMIPLVGNALSIISTSGWTGLRAANYDMSVAYMSTIQTYLHLYFVRPCTMATLIVGVWALLHGGRSSKTIFFLGFFGAALDVFVTAGRNSIFNTIVLMLIALAMGSNRQRVGLFIRKIMKPAIIIPTIIAIIFVLVVSSDRSGANDSVGEIIYQYFFAGPVMLTQLLNMPQAAWVPNQDFMFGWATFGFVINIPLTAGLVLGQGVQTSTYWVGSVLTATPLQISDHLYSNAICTCYFDFLLDWGYAGVVIGPILLALTGMFLVRKLQSSKQVFWASLSLYWLYLLYRTTFRWDPIDISVTAVIALIALFSYRRVARKSKDE